VTGKLAAWVQAARPLAQANLAPALLLGQALAYTERGTFSLHALLLAQLFGVLDQLFILFVNDYADTETDALNRSFTPYSGGSRVVPEGKLTRAELGRGALLALAALLVFSGTVAVWRDNWVLLALTLGGVALVWGYSLPPLRLAYRGRGELLQALGVGVVLPLFGYAIQRGSLEGLPLVLPVGGALLGYAGNLSTCLPDQSSDALSDKRSYAVRFGQRRTRLTSLCVVALGCALLALGLPGLAPGARAACLALGLAPLLLNARQLGDDAAPAGREATRFVLLNGLAIVLSFVGPTLGLLLNPAG
jgi:1,4-dihydroxy-2-naphthoate octaprenyltransferase